MIHSRSCSNKIEQLQSIVHDLHFSCGNAWNHFIKTGNNVIKHVSIGACNRNLLESIGLSIHHRWAALVWTNCLHNTSVLLLRLAMLQHMECKARRLSSSYQPDGVPLVHFGEALPDCGAEK